MPLLCRFGGALLVGAGTADNAAGNGDAGGDNAAGTADGETKLLARS